MAQNVGNSMNEFDDAIISSLIIYEMRSASV